ncbi:copper resistance protein NlpE [Porphyromonas sp.]|uniref:copper resistance protein NlpE n=1 Tax=Porphyromonas sp. TaxID=1924944 RepID=UPI0026DDB85F|nr:copper resistance protein NlpE [Porphyromonas sp.]MDO4695729.1 copper resistance protein NlpE [Porphyromonas sp.]MDO4771745.1 copper resistance protein NlpE [Porphyromonas sp.]
MKKSLLLGLSFVALMAFAACTGTAKKTTDGENAQVEQTEQVAEAKAWVGTYEGVLPTASGEGVKVTISLNEDNTFASKEEYINADTVVDASGVIEWAEDGVKFTLVEESGEKKMYLLGEGTITVLNADGAVVEGEMADMYILRKI